jgi:mitochondrial fission protein ELM1
MTDLTVIDKGNHCEIHQGDAIAADYVASKRLANLFAASPELLYQLKQAVALIVEKDLFDWEDAESGNSFQAMEEAIRVAEGRG